MTNNRLALKIKASILFNLDFAKNSILLCFFFFFLITDLYLLIPAVIAQVFNPVAELVIPTGIPIKKQKQKLKYTQ